MAQIQNTTLSVEEAAAELGICTKIMYDLVHVKGFPAFRIGRKIRISREGFQQWIQNRVKEGI